MKRILLVLMACFPVIGLMAAEVEPLAGDTIITLERKRIEVKDNGDRMKVRVYEVDEDGDSVDDELIFEGHYRDGQSYERRKHVKSINIPVPTWDKDFNPHWAGFGMGFANFADGSLHVNDVDGVSLRSVIKTCSSSKIVYNDASGKKHKEKMDSGMNIRPVTMDFLFQAGWDWIGLYAKYSPIDLFENGKGPKVHPVSIGLQLHL